MNWLEKRLGCRGENFYYTFNQLQKCIYDEKVITNRSIGLSGSQLSKLSKKYQLKEISLKFPSCGDEEGLKHVAWNGSALGDIACSRKNPEKTKILEEAALFNLAVSLFDTVVDDLPKKLPNLAEALKPIKLKHRIIQPRNQSFMLISEEPELNLIVRLFDSSLASIGERLCNNTQRIQYIYELLDEMYKSELILSSDPFIAKTLPVFFLGALANNKNRRDVNELFNLLSHFLNLIDDWYDLGDDICRFKPNILLKTSIETKKFHFIKYTEYVLARIIRGEYFHIKDTENLKKSLIKVIKASKLVNHETYKKTITFLEEFLFIEKIQL